MITLLSLSLFLLSLTSCVKSFSDNEAVLLLSEYYQEKITTGSTELVKYYSDDFWNRTSEDDWLELLDCIEDRTGSYKHGTLIGVKTNIEVNSSDLSGITYELSFKNSYEKGEVVENFRLYKSSNEYEFKIMSHQFYSDLFEK